METIATRRISNTFLSLRRVGVAGVGIAPSQDRILEAPPELRGCSQDPGVDKAYQREVLQQIVLQGNLQEIRINKPCQKNHEIDHN